MARHIVISVLPSYPLKGLPSTNCTLHLSIGKTTSLNPPHPCWVKGIVVFANLLYEH